MLASHFQSPSQFPAGLYPAFSASSFVSNQILFSSFMRNAPEHHGKWYAAPFLDATYFWLELGIMKDELGDIEFSVFSAVSLFLIPNS